MIGFTAPAQFLYTTNNGAITITGFTGTNTDVVIPGTLSGRPVTSIGTNAFYQQTQITSVTVPDSVITVGDEAFYGCSALASLELGAGVTQIGVDAFGFCSSLINVTFPANVGSLGSLAFEQCTGLLGVEFDGNAPSADATAFSGDGSASGYYLPGTANWGTTLGGLAMAPAYFFATNSGAITVTGGNNGFVGPLAFPSTLFGLPLVGVAASAFENNSGVTSVSIPNSVTNIGDGAFSQCTTLITLTVGTGNPAYSTTAGVLFDKAQTTLIQYPVGNSGKTYTIPNSVTNIAANAFRFATNLLSITFPSGLTRIGDDAFDNCSSVGSLTLPGSLASIGASVFSDWYSLTNLTLRNGLRNIGQGAFSQCLKLPSVVIPDSVTNLEANAFQESPELANVTIGNGVTAIGDYAFYDCGLTNVTLGSNVVTIGNSAFYSCLFTDVVLPDSLRSIGDGAFQYCQLSAIVLPNSVTNVGTYAFANCYLTMAVIGTGVSTIVDSTFATNWGLSIVSFGGNAPSIVDTAFAGDAPTAFYVPGTAGWGTNIAGMPTQPAFFVATNFGAITITAGNTNLAGPLAIPSAIFGQPVISIADFAFAGTPLLTRITVPDSVSSIGSAPFLYCSNLTAIEVAADSPSYGTLGGVLFNKSQTALMEFPAGNGQASFTVPSTVTSIGNFAFAGAGLTNIVLDNALISIGAYAFEGCTGLSSVALPASLAGLGTAPFLDCSSLTAINVAASNPTFASVGGVLFNHSQTTLLEYPEAAAPASYLVPSAVTQLGEYGFSGAGNLTAIYFQSNAPNADSTVFANDTATIFYVPGTTGWGTNFEGLATALWTLQITQQPESQSVFPGTNASFSVSATGPPPPLTYAWFFDGAAVQGATESTLVLSNVQSSNSGVYQVVATNVYGAITSTPASLTVTDFFVLPAPQFQVTSPTNILSLQGFLEGSGAGTIYSWSKVSGLEQVTFDNPLIATNSLSSLSSGLDQIRFTDPSSSLSSVIFGFAGTYEVALTATTGTNVSVNRATVTASVSRNGPFTNVSELVNGPLLTNGNTFLSYPNYTSTSADADAYYAAIGATSTKSTLNLWKIANGIPTNQIPPAATNFMNGIVAATYFNCLDLGFARRMIMGSNGGNWAYSVSNYRTLADAINDTNKIATVTMDYSALPGSTNRFTKFYVYNSSDQLIPAADLDGGGAKFVPGLCEVCHGGTNGTVTAGQGNVHAHFLAFDVRALDYGATSNFTQVALEPEIRLLNQGVFQIEQDIASEDPSHYSPAITDLIQGWYGVGLTNPVQNTEYVPRAWQDRSAINTLSLAGQAYLYKSVVAPSCRSCHETRADSQNLDFRSFTNFNGYAGVGGAIKTAVFNTNALSWSKRIDPSSLVSSRTMPQARRTFQRFWNSLTPRPQANILVIYLEGYLDSEIQNYYSPPPPVMAGVQQIGNDLLLDVQTAGGSYTLQSATDAAHPVWVPLPGTISGNYYNVQVVEPMPSGQPKTFYRVVGQP